MQFCPRCGARNQDGRAACWKCFGQIQAGSKKAQRIQLTDNDAPVAGVDAASEPAVEETLAAAAVVTPIPELAEPESEPAVPVADFAVSTPAEPEAAPVFAVDEPVAVEEPAPQVASLGDVMIPSPSFGAADGTDEDADDVPAKPVPILGLVNLPEDEQDEPAALDLDDPQGGSALELGALADEPIVVGTTAGPESADSTDEPPLPWWLTQDESDDPSSGAAGGNVLDLDDGLEIVSLDDDSDTKKSPPNA